MDGDTPANKLRSRGSMCLSTIAPISGQALNSGPIKASEGAGVSALMALRAF